MIRKYNVNDNYFKTKTKQSIYWAGFLAADGWLKPNSNEIYLSCAEKDKKHLEQFKQDIQSESPISLNIKKKDGKTYNQFRIRMSSKKNRAYLNKFYNLTENKSLTLLSPNLSDNNEIDYFIKGYIDGDGSIFFHQRNINQQPVLHISIIGTKDVLSFIKKRFSEILDIKKCGSLQKKKKNNDNTYVFSINNAYARKIFSHYYKLECNCLKRKWSIKNNDYCIKFDNQYLLSRLKPLFYTYKKLYETNFLGVCPKYKYRVKKSKTYNLFLSMLDQGVQDIETKES